MWGILFFGYSIHAKPLQVELASHWAHLPTVDYYSLATDPLVSLQQQQKDHYGKGWKTIGLSTPLKREQRNRFPSPQLEHPTIKEECVQRDATSWQVVTSWVYDIKQIMFCYESNVINSPVTFIRGHCMEWTELLQVEVQQLWLWAGWLCLH